MKRRTLLKAAAGLSLIAGLPYSLWRGVRYPRLSLEKHPHDPLINNDIGSLLLNNCFEVQTHKQSTATNINSNTDTNSNIEAKAKTKTNKTNHSPSIALRAYAPEPSIVINHAKHAFILSLNNIADNAILISNDSLINVSLQEEKKGITRFISIPKTDQAITLKWQLPEMDSFKFTAIGDTGGDRELEWCIKRAHQLNSQFFLHLGDLNYAEGDYDNAIEQLNNAPLPCYVTVGNHDFHDNGLIVGKFINEIGPLNNQFSLNGVRFVNIDTAASFLPVSGGLRAHIIDDLKKDTKHYSDSVVFTHRAFHDPRPNEDHDLGNNKERDWLIDGLKASNITTVLFGHIHLFNDAVYQGIRSIIAGQGLGHADLITQKQVSKIVVGQVKKGEKVNYVFEELAMPLEYHCHPRVTEFREDHPDHPTSKRLEGVCT